MEKATELTEQQEPFSGAKSSNPFELSDQIQKYLSNLQDSITTLEPIIFQGDNALNESSTKDMLHKLLLATNGTLESIGELIKSPQRNNSVQINKNNKAFTSLFSEFMDLATEFFTRGAFPNFQMYTYIIPFSSLHYIYYKMIVAPTVNPPKEKFLSAWRQFYSCFSNIKLLIHDIDFDNYTQKLEELFNETKIVIPSFSTEEIINSVLDVEEALTDLKQQLSILNSSPPPVEVLQNTKNALSRFQNEYHELITLTSVRTLDYSIIGQLMFIVNTSLLCYDVLFLATKIDNLINQDNFILDQISFGKLPGALYSVSCQAAELLQHEIRYAITTVPGMNHLIHQTGQMALTTVKSLSDALRQCVLDHDIIARICKNLRKLEEFVPVYDEILEAKVTSAADKFMSVCKNNTWKQNEPYIKQAETSLQTFKQLKVNGKIPFDTAVRRYWAFSRFKDFCDRSQDVDQSSRDIDRDNSFSLHLAMHALASKVTEITPYLINSFPEIVTRAPMDCAGRFIFQVNKGVRDISKMLATLIERKSIPAGSETFCRTLQLFTVFVESLTDPHAREMITDQLNSVLRAFPMPERLIAALDPSAHLAETIQLVAEVATMCGTNSSRIVELQKMPTSIDVESLKNISMKNMGTSTVISKMFAKIRTTSTMIKLIAAYPILFNLYCVPRQNDLDPNKSTIEETVADRTLSFLQPLVSMIRSRSISRHISYEFANNLMMIFTGLFDDNEEQRAEGVMGTIQFIPNPDVSKPIQTTLFNSRIARSKIYIWGKNHPNTEPEVKSCLEEMEKAKKILLNSILKGEVKYQDFLNQSVAFIESAERLSNTVGTEVKDSWASCEFLMTNLNTIQEVVQQSITASTYEGVAKQMFPSKNYLTASFFISYINSVSSAMQIIVDRNYIKGVTAPKLAQFINYSKIVIHSYVNLLELPAPDVIVKLIQNYYEARVAININAVHNFVVKVPSYLDNITIYGGTKGNRNSFDVFKIVSKLGEIVSSVEALPSSEQFDSISLFSTYTQKLRTLFGPTDSRGVETLLQLNNVIEQALYLLFVQDLSLIGDVFCARLSLVLGVPLPSIIGPISTPTPEEAVPVSSFIGALPSIKSDFEQLVRSADALKAKCGDSKSNGVINALNGVRDDINQAITKALDVAKSTNVITEAMIEEMNDKIAANVSMQEDLHELLIDCKALHKKIQDRGKKEFDTVSLVMDEFATRSRRMIDLQTSIRQLESEINRMHISIHDIEMQIAGVTRSITQIRPPLVNLGNDNSTIINDDKDEVALVEISEQLSTLMQENETLRRKLKAAKTNSGKMGLDIVAEAVANLKERRSELLSLISADTSESVQSAEKAAVKNDEELFEAFDPLKESINSLGLYGSIQPMDVLVKGLFGALQAHDECVTKAKQFVARRRYLKKEPVTK